MADLSRREFIGAVPAILLASTRITRTDASPIRIALVYSPEYNAVQRAATMSAREVERAAGLLDRDFEFLALVDTAGSTLDPAWSAIIVATNRSLVLPAVPTVDVSGVLPCAANVLKLTPPAHTTLRVWHHRLERFGAAQLNDRFRAAGIAPDDQAWLGWFAVKLSWEAAVRGRSPAELRYDGHKGMPLRFNDAGVLLQPLYEVAGDQVVREVKPDAAREQVTCAS